MRTAMVRGLCDNLMAIFDIAIDRYIGPPTAEAQLNRHYGCALPECLLRLRPLSNDPHVYHTTEEPEEDLGFIIR